MYADSVVYDRDGTIVLMVEVRPTPAGEDPTRWFLESLADSPGTIEFGMLVDPRTIRIFRRGNPDPVATFDSTPILKHYAPDYTGDGSKYGSVQTFHSHMLTLAEAWIDDLAYRWRKPVEAPGRDEVRSIGLLGLIEGGMSSQEVPSRGGPLR